MRIVLLTLGRDAGSVAKKFSHRLLLCNESDEVVNASTLRTPCRFPLMQNSRVHMCVLCMIVYVLRSRVCLARGMYVGIPMFFSRSAKNPLL